MLLVIIFDFYWFVYLSGKISFTENNDLTNWFSLSVEAMLALYLGIAITVYFHNKEEKTKEKKRKIALSQICDRFVHLTEHVKAVDDAIKQYYRVSNPANQLGNYPANIALIKEQASKRISGLKDSAASLENILILVSVDLDHKTKSGIRFLLEVIRRDTELFENEFADIEKLNGLTGVTNATKEKLTKYNPEIIKKAESEFEELKQKIRINKPNLSSDIMDFVWKE